METFDLKSSRHCVSEIHNAIILFVNEKSGEILLFSLSQNLLKLECVALLLRSRSGLNDHLVSLNFASGLEVLVHNLWCILELKTISIDQVLLIKKFFVDGDRSFEEAHFFVEYI